LISSCTEEEEFSLDKTECYVSALFDAVLPLSTVFRGKVSMKKVVEGVVVMTRRDGPLPCSKREMEDVL